MKKLSDEEEFMFYDERAKLLGSPGYRNMLGKSGLGYIESVITGD
ncbi:MAG: hypothetical protein WA821_21735 [Anaerolineales bacterium]